MDLKGDISAGELESSATERRESNHKGGSYGAALFLARAIYGQATKGASGGDNHRGFSGRRKGQGGVRPPNEVLPSSVG